MAACLLSPVSSRLNPEDRLTALMLVLRPPIPKIGNIASTTVHELRR